MPAALTRVAMPMMTVATIAGTGAEAVSVIDGGTCNATTTSGCAKKPPLVTLGKGSVDYNVAFAIDQACGTLYVANWASDTLSMINKASCNATVTAGCAQTPPVVRVGRGPDGIAVNPATHTAYVANVTDDTVSVLDAAIWARFRFSSQVTKLRPDSLR
jgi:DNA-binding beta-propeller fold protein YncE